MAEASFIRRVRFSAAHRYGRSDWSEERNRSVFGDAASLHGHDFTVAVTVRGEMDPETGFVVNLTELDRLLESEIVEPLDQRNLNEVVAPFRDETTQPSTESLARWLWERLVGRIPGTARMVKIRVEEGRDLAAEYSGG